MYDGRLTFTRLRASDIGVEFVPNDDRALTAPSRW